MRALVLTWLAVLWVVASACNKTEERDEPPSPGPTAPPQQWPRYASEACGFDVSLPFARSEGPTPAGALDMIATENRTQKMAFMAMCGTQMVPEGNDELGASLDAVANALQGRIVESTEIQLQGRRGRQGRVSVSDAKSTPFQGPVEVHVRVFAARDRIYVVQALVGGEVDGRDQVDTFFESFRFHEAVAKP